MPKGKLSSSRGGEGYVLIWVLFYLLLFYAMLMAFSEATFIEELISINHRKAAQAFEMADGGIQVGVQEIHAILERDYRLCQEIPAQLTLSKQEWIINNSNQEIGFCLENPRLSLVSDNECCFQFSSRGFCPPAQRVLQAEVAVEFLDVYKVGADGTMVFNHREYFKPARIVSLKYN